MEGDSVLAHPAPAACALDIAPLLEPLARAVQREMGENERHHTEKMLSSEWAGASLLSWQGIGVLKLEGKEGLWVHGSSLPHSVQDAAVTRWSWEDASL